MSNAPDRYEKFVVPEGVEKCASPTSTSSAPHLMPWLTPCWHHCSAGTKQPRFDPIRHAACRGLLFYDVGIAGCHASRIQRSKTQQR